MRLPRTIRFSAHHRVKIVLVSQAQMNELNDHEDEVVQGIWDPEMNTIYVLRSLGTNDRWRVLWHELLHTVADLGSQQEGLNT